MGYIVKIKTGRYTSYLQVGFRGRYFLVSLKEQATVFLREEGFHSAQEAADDYKLLNPLTPTPVVVGV